MRRPELITEGTAFGSQCVVLSVEAKRRAGEAAGRLHRQRPRAKRASTRRVGAAGRRLGAGEVLLTSVDMEGTRKGFDLELIALSAAVAGVPVIACGGAGTIAHVAAALRWRRRRGRGREPAPLQDRASRGSSRPELGRGL